MAAGHAIAEGSVLLPLDAIQTVQYPVLRIGLYLVVPVVGTRIDGGIISKNLELDFHVNISSVLV
jgi:hypothetical protein